MFTSSPLWNKLDTFFGISIFILVTVMDFIRIAQRLAAPIKDFYWDSGTEGRPSLEKVSPDDPEFKPVFDLFENFDVPLTIISLTSQTSKAKSEIEAVADPNSVNIAYYEPFTDFSPGWVAHDVFHAIDGATPFGGYLNGYEFSKEGLDLEKKMYEAFLKDFSNMVDQNMVIGGDFNAMGMATYFSSLPSIEKHGRAIRHNYNGFPDVSPDMMIEFVTNNGIHRPPPELKYRSVFLVGPVGEHGTETYYVAIDDSSVIERSSDELNISKPLIPNNNGLPNMNRVFKEFYAYICDRIQTYLYGGIGKIVYVN